MVCDDVAALGEERHVSIRRQRCVSHRASDGIVGALLAPHREADWISTLVGRGAGGEVFRCCRAAHARNAVQVVRVVQDYLLSLHHRKAVDGGRNSTAFHRNDIVDIRGLSRTEEAVGEHRIRGAVVVASPLRVVCCAGGHCEAICHAAYAKSEFIDAIRRNRPYCPCLNHRRHGQCH